MYVTRVYLHLALSSRGLPLRTHSLSSAAGLRARAKQGGLGVVFPSLSVLFSSIHPSIHQRDHQFLSYLNSQSFRSLIIQDTLIVRVCVVCQWSHTALLLEFLLSFWGFPKHFKKDYRSVLRKMYFHQMHWTKYFLCVVAQHDVIFNSSFQDASGALIYTRQYNTLIFFSFSLIQSYILSRQGEYILTPSCWLWLPRRSPHVTVWTVQSL